MPPTTRSKTASTASIASSSWDIISADLEGGVGNVVGTGTSKAKRAAPQVTGAFLFCFFIEAPLSWG